MSSAILEAKLIEDDNIKTRQIFKIDLPADGGRDWVFIGLDVTPSYTNMMQRVDEGDVYRFFDLVMNVSGSIITNLRSFVQTLEGHPDVECDEDTDGTLFADVKTVCESIDKQWDMLSAKKAYSFTLVTEVDG